MKINTLFDKPKVMAIVGDRHTGKSNLIHYILSELKKQGSFNLFVYGLHSKVEEATEIFSTTTSVA